MHWLPTAAYTCTISKDGSLCVWLVQDAGYVAREMGALVAAAAKQYEASGPGPAATPGQGVNLEDPWARLHLARACAYVLHSDQSSGDVSRDGAPFWHMLHLLAMRSALRGGKQGRLNATCPGLGAGCIGSDTQTYNGWTDQQVLAVLRTARYVQPCKHTSAQHPRHHLLYNCRSVQDELNIAYKP